MLRVISQDREWDFPYETTVIHLPESVEPEEWRVVAHGACGAIGTMAIYSTKEAALMEMARLRGTFLDYNNYGDTNDVFMFSADEGV